MVKDVHGYDVKVPSKGATDYAVVGGSLGIASFLGLNANNILGNGCGGGLFGGMNRNNGNCGCSPYDMPVTRYEMAMQNELASKDSKIALLEANIFTDSKITDAYKELRGMISNLQDFAAKQSVQNQAFADSFHDVRKDIDYKVQLEAERRACADCKIVNYANSTFAPKLVTDFAAGTTSAVAQVYNPLGCGTGCGCGNIYAGPSAQ
jgi:hypothetical protein